MKTLLLALVLLPFVASAQQPTPAAAPTAAPNICDQTFSAITETADHDMVMYLPGPFIAAQPWADVQANHAEQIKVLKVLADEQNKGGEYTVTVSETNACDGGPTVRVPSGSLFVEGVTLKGLNKVAREMLKSGDVIVKRYEDREAKGAKMAWNHKNAKKVQRDELGNVIPPGQAKK